LNKLLATDIIKFAERNFESPGQHHAEIIPLIEWLLNKEIKNIFELGCYLRCNSSVLASVAIGKKIFLDNTNAPQADQKLKAMFPDVQIHVADSHLQTSAQWVRDSLNGELFDFMFIDGDHSYEGVKQDYEMYWEFLKPGCWMAFHDINDSPTHHQMGCFVDEFWREISSQYEHMEFNAHEDWAGIGLIRKPL